MKNLANQMLAGCGERIDSNRFVGTDDIPDIPYPVVERDLDEIRGTGILRMITHYSSSGYFIHKGGQAGFDYELLSHFAKEKGLTLGPLSIYLKGHLVKVEIGLAKGRKEFRKKEVIKERDVKRETAREVKSWK